MLIQTIHTQWSKKSRGEPQATLRNTTPEFLLLPEVTKTAHTVCHYCQYNEPDFSLDEQTRLRDRDYNVFFELVVSYEDNVIKGTLLQKHTLIIHPYESASFVYNYRELIPVDGRSETRYHKVCINVFHSSEFDRHIFRKPFNHNIRLLRDLW